MGLFGRLFDFNHDGNVTGFEKAGEICFLSALLQACEEEEELDEIAEAGLDRDELSYMDEEERREALEDAGLDPDDYDEYDFL